LERLQRHVLGVVESAAMGYMGGAEGYYAVVDLIHTEMDPCICWQKLLAATKQLGVQRLTAIDVGAEITSVSQQLKKIWLHEPIPADATFLYFGLFDLHDEKMPKGRAGFYLSGGSGLNPAEQLRVGSTLPYLPKNGHLRCELLEQIKIAEAEMPDNADVLDYAVMLGGAALAVKGAIQAQRVVLPVYVGFDAGDFLLVSAQ
jgi:hypothetical protein